MPVHLPDTVDAAVVHLAQDPAATVLAGGTDLMVEVNDGHRRPGGSVVVVNRITELRSWRRDQSAGSVTIGAAVSYREIETGPLGPADEMIHIGTVRNPRVGRRRAQRTFEIVDMPMRARTRHATKLVVMRTKGSPVHRASTQAHGQGRRTRTCPSPDTRPPPPAGDPVDPAGLFEPGQAETDCSEAQHGLARR